MSTEQNTGWIPLADLEPKHGERYLVWVRTYSFADVATYADGGFRSGNWYPDDVTHYRILPEPPEQEEK